MDSKWTGQDVTYPDLQVSLLHGLQAEERLALVVRHFRLVIPAVILFVVQGLVMDEHIGLQVTTDYHPMDIRSSVLTQ